MKDQSIMFGYYFLENIWLVGLSVIGILMDIMYSGGKIEKAEFTILFPNGDKRDMERHSE